MSINTVVVLFEEMPDKFFDDDELDFDGDSVEDSDYDEDGEDDFLLNAEDDYLAEEKEDISKQYYPYFRGSNGGYDDDYC